MSVLEKLTEGIVHRNVKKEGQALLEKWEQTGLLEGISDEQRRNGMAVLLENQAKELLREASSMSAGDVEGFASVAFPIVRRVFGGLIANELVSVQPMSLPSGLIFFLDFVHSDSRAGSLAGKSIYGGNVVAKGLMDGVDLTATAERTAKGGFYDLSTGYSSPTGSIVRDVAATQIENVLVSALTDAQKKLLRYDPDILSDSTLRVSQYAIHQEQLPANFPISASSPGHPALAAVSASHNGNANAGIVRRLTRITGSDGDKSLLVTFLNRGATAGAAAAAITLTFPLLDSLGAGGGLGSVVASDLPFEGIGEGQNVGGRTVEGTAADRVGADTIPEIDIKVDSVAVTAVAKKLKAKWTPELGQDLNAYHNLDAEVELTGILSEQIALEIDQEILGDLIKGAKAGTRYWSRAPGLFVDVNGNELGAAAAAPDFTGTVSEWYETLIETINDVSAQIHRKTLRGGANFVVCSPEVANILEFTSGFRASVTADADRGDIGAVKVGSLSKKFDIMVDPYFPRNVLLVGRRGNSFLESGYVYAPYVPLQVTPTIFGTEDFVPRKGVMTRYAKQMVRPDMYGLVIVRGLLGEEGSS